METLQSSWRISSVALFFLALSVQLIPSRSDAVMYRATFHSTWSASTHPGVPLPAGAHFSSLVGAIHGSEVEFWRPGRIASPGIESMAETGNTGLLSNEIQQAITAGTAKRSLQGSGLDSTPSSTSLQFEIEPSSLVTLVTMIAPSPDWFVGVHGLNLRPEGYWTRQVQVPLFPYDAGTDSGALFNSADANTQPRQPISRLDQTAGAQLNGSLPFGTFTFDLLTRSALGDLDNDQAMDGRDAAILYSAWGSADPLSDINSDGIVDGADLRVLFSNWTGDNAASMAVPEPPITSWVTVACLAWSGHARRIVRSSRSLALRATS
ncbi:MAG: spondin domain-containing protein [Planctomycetota bacterium]|nr:spondin domain-containing protein [Planctomycetota bacterium]